MRGCTKNDCRLLKPFFEDMRMSLLRASNGPRSLTGLSARILRPRKAVHYTFEFIKYFPLKKSILSVLRSLSYHFQ